MTRLHEGLVSHADGDAGLPLLERKSELQALERLIEALASGIGSLVFIEGSAGIGKTRLLAEAVKLAAERKVAVYRAIGGELEREIPFGIARQLFEPVIARCSADERGRLLSGSAAWALGALGRADPKAAEPIGDPFAPLHGLYWLVANLAESESLVLAIDDAQWADLQTLRFLDVLARRLVDLPVVVIAGVRSGEPDEPEEVGRLRLRAKLIRPQSLSEGAVGELIAASLAAEPSSEFRGACWRATRGNPFLLEELLRALRDDTVEPDGDAAAMISTMGPESVARHVLVRLGRFGEQAISLARAVAVLGGSPQLRHAARLAELDDQQARRLCDRLRDAEILAPGLPIDFVHPLVRQAVHREIREGEESELHRRAAEILSSTGIEPREVAPHLLACAPNGDQWVVEKLGEAAWEAIRSGAPQTGTAYFERALEESPGDDLPILYGLGRAVLGTDPRRARAVLTDVVERAPDERTRTGAAKYAAYAATVAGDWSEAGERWARLIELTTADDLEQRLAAEAQLFVIRVGTGRDRSDWERIAAAAADSGPQTPAGCLVRQAMALGRVMDVAPVDEVVELASAFPPPAFHAKSLAPGGACITLAWCGRWDEARRGIESFLQEARRAGVVATITYGVGVAAMVDLSAGRLAEAEAQACTASEIIRSVAPDSEPGFGATQNLVAARLARGDLEGAQRVASGLDLSAGAAEVRFPPYPLELRGYLRLASGATETGVDDLLEFGEGAERLRFLNPAFSAWRQEAAPALAALDRTPEATRILAVAEDRARAFGAAHVIGTVLRARALLEPRKSQIQTLRESVTALESYGPPHELARSLVELGAALRRDGQRADARQPLRRALELAHCCRAGGLERSAREELAATGARPRRAMITGRDALTATEQRIAGMAAKGMSNPQIAQSLFVTPKTVENHLGRIYPKLGINSRTQLAEALTSPPTSPIGKPPPAK